MHENKDLRGASRTASLLQILVTTLKNEVFTRGQLCSKNLAYTKLAFCRNRTDGRRITNTMLYLWAKKALVFNFYVLKIFVFLELLLLRKCYVHCINLTNFFGKERITPTAKLPNNSFHRVKFLAGAEGFEPPNDRVKTGCLTTWPRPICNRIIKQDEKKIKKLKIFFNPWEILRSSAPAKPCSSEAGLQRSCPPSLRGFAPWSPPGPAKLPPKLFPISLVTRRLYFSWERTF